LIDSRKPMRVVELRYRQGSRDIRARV